MLLPIPRSRLLGAAAPIAAAMLLGGCAGTPTYGTGTPADEQLLTDVTSMFSLRGERKEPIDYKPRPELVKPASKDALPEPQASVAATDNPSWPESPEARRKRYQNIATANQNDPNFEPLVDTTASSTPAVREEPNDRKQHSGQTGPAATAATRAEFNRRLAITKQGDPNVRRYLSEPPVEYRQAAATAPADDIGEDESKKEARAKKAAQKGRSWKDMVPWL